MPEETLKVNIACFATQGSGSRDELRIAQLLQPLSPHVVPFDPGKRVSGAISLVRRLRALRPDAVVMEGTGVAGGVAVMTLQSSVGVPYVVSSGDAVAPFLANVSPALGVAGGLYERLLCRRSSGFIGWSPYLVGRALTFGSPRAMTAPNWAEPPSGGRGAEIRSSLGIPADAVVFGIVGSLNWTPRVGYCYGLELVQAAVSLRRTDAAVLIVGDGDGRPRLEELAGDRLGRSIFLPGAVPRSAVGDYLEAMDVASLPQSVDGVGSFRYTTKISEYLAARLPVVTGEIPLAYDLDDGWIWRLPGDAPWDERYIASLRRLMSSLDRQEVLRRKPAYAHRELFDRDRQVRQVSAFVRDVVARREPLTGREPPS